MLAATAGAGAEPKPTLAEALLKQKLETAMRDLAHERDAHHKTKARLAAIVGV